MNRGSECTQRGGSGKVIIMRKRSGSSFISLPTYLPTYLEHPQKKPEYFGDRYTREICVAFNYLLQSIPFGEMTTIAAWDVPPSRAVPDVAQIPKCLCTRSEEIERSLKTFSNSTEYIRVSY